MRDKEFVYTGERMVPEYESPEWSREVHQAWSQLNPIFIMGMQRSGTSIVQMALASARFFSFGEGHLWLELVEHCARFCDPEYRPGTKRKYWALGEGRDILFARYIALAIDRFHRENLPWDNPVRWVDKSPGSAPVTLAPLLAGMFPESQFIFMYRNGITTVYSGIAKFDLNDPGAFRRLCCGWASTMRAWRQVRSSLKGRYIELAQEKMADNPAQTAVRLANFLGIPEHHDAFAEHFRLYRPNTAFPEKPPGDYSYEVNWSEERREFFVQTCAEEMRAWGYPVCFVKPTGPSARGVSEPLPPLSWQRPWRKAWLILQRDGVLALLRTSGQFLYWRFLHRFVGEVTDVHRRRLLGTRQHKGTG